MLKGRKPTQKEREYLSYCVQIPCLACSIFHDVHDTPAEYHHVNGKTIEGAHFQGFSLCAKHHRHPDHNEPKRWISRHGDGKKAFERRYMSEEEFIKIQRARVKELKEKCL